MRSPATLIISGERIPIYIQIEQATVIIRFLIGPLACYIAEFYVNFQLLGSPRQVYFPVTKARLLSLSFEKPLP
jgi:hypothetical protein